eukprot:CAMPEP_0185759888 /NCGR_PEP_ID=MMETSP1174-20130828/18700_1 /TAXON_ID=35687 /ORGANISM="Dictyocha speculum, Strain CCMP1381" /LENGTH=45 /DNA_ID= /DNA_START= /DNA_END= /DNA_ORIENTATION=
MTLAINAGNVIMRSEANEPPKSWTILSMFGYIMAVDTESPMMPML